MIAAWLCGVMFGWLGYHAWWVKPRTLKAEPWDVLCGQELFRFDQGDTIEIVDQTLVVPPSDDDFDMKAWDKLSDEALINFEGELNGDFGILSDYVPDSGLRVCWPQEEWKRRLSHPFACATDNIACGPPRNCPMNPLYGRTTSGG